MGKNKALAHHTFPSASTGTPASTASERSSSKKKQTAQSAPSSTSAAPPWTPNVHGHPSTSRPAESSGRSNGSAGICGPPDSRYVRAIRHSRTSLRLASTTLASGAGSSSIRPTPARWSTAKVRPTATPTYFPDSLNQPPTTNAPDAIASLAPTLLTSTPSAPAASHRTSRLRRGIGLGGLAPPPSKLIPITFTYLSCGL